MNHLLTSLAEPLASFAKLFSHCLLLPLATIIGCNIVPAAVIDASTVIHHPSAQSAHSTTQTRNHSRNQQNSLSKRKITDHHYRHPFSFQSTDHYTISLPDSAISVICCLYWDIALTRFFNQICSAIETTNTSQQTNHLLDKSATCLRCHPSNRTKYRASDFLPVTLCYTR